MINFTKIYFPFHLHPSPQILKKEQGDSIDERLNLFQVYVNLVHISTRVKNAKITINLSSQ